MASGISDYSFELLPIVAEAADVDAVCPRGPFLRRVKTPPGIRRRDPGVIDPGSYDSLVYHLGNNPHHRFVYEAAMAHPGVAVFHDFLLHHLVAHMTVEYAGGLDPERYVRLMREDHGERGERAAMLRLRHVATEFEKFVFPLNRHVASRSRAIVVHSEDSKARMEEIAPGVPITVIPHHAGTPPAQVEEVDKGEARRRLRLPQEGFLVGHFGFVTKPKQPGAVVGGFAKLADRHPGAVLLIVGADNTGGGLQRLIRRHGLDGRVRLTGFLDLKHFYLYLRAVDVVVNLRYPSAGESSGTFARALAEGRAAIVNNYGSFAEIPPDVALKVEVDGNQTEEVGLHLVHLAEDPVFRAHVEERARSYATDVLDPRRCRDLYLEVARQAMAVTSRT